MPENEQIISMIEHVNPAVVSVVVTKDVPIYERYYEQFDPWGLFGGFSVPRTRELGTEEKEVGGGSGFVVSDNGLIVTNRHVVDDPEARYSILTNDGVAYDVEVLARDQQLDIAVLKVLDLPEDVVLPSLSFGDSESLKLGQRVVAIGNALAEFRNSVSVGVVSGLARSITATDGSGRSENLDQVIQTDAAINPGNSGGPLLDIDGNVIGVNVATSRGADNIGFALPAHVVKGVVESVKEHGKIVRPFLGVRYVMIDPELQKKNNITVDYGALIARGESRDELAVMPGSPADKAGLVENDIILSIDGEKLGDSDLATILRSKQVGDTIKLTILHKGVEETKAVTLIEMPNGN
ncbi:MAG: trypsin-like peptidase domain-containing protein [Candidatus Nomurabacteria bacterium]|nr:MAG: trypsin-like peptidase domain-containing protein [Candidatus Nomurabacteria bacterium]